MDIHIHIAGDLIVQSPPVELTELSAKLDDALALITQIGDTMSDLSDAVDALQGRITEDVDHLLQVIQDGQAREVALQAQLDAALANDAADAAAVAQAQADAAAATEARDAALADAQAAVDRIKNIDPDPAFPVEEDPGAGDGEGEPAPE